MNCGYRIGLLTRHLRAWVIRVEEKAIRRGLSRRTARLFTLLSLMAVAGMIIAWATIIAVLMALAALIVFLIATTPDTPDDGDERAPYNPLKDAHLEGYQSYGPQGPGMYVGGRKVSNYDTED